MPTYFHGGQPGMKPGMFILPPEITRAPSCSEYGAAGIHRRDRVYLCTYPEARHTQRAQGGDAAVPERRPPSSLAGALQPNKQDWLT
jgi:hypothetical protein